MAFINGLTPKMLIIRVILQASTCRLISVLPGDVTLTLQDFCVGKALPSSDCSSIFPYPERRLSMTATRFGRLTAACGNEEISNGRKHRDEPM